MIRPLIVALAVAATVTAPAASADPGTVTVPGDAGALQCIDRHRAGDARSCPPR